MIKNNLWLSSENDSCSHLEIACVRELVRTRDMGKGESHSHPWHVDIRVGICILCLNVCMFVIAWTLRWGVALVGEFIYWALLTPSWENIFRC